MFTEQNINEHITVGIFIQK